jgi:hypothetical protein
MELEHSNRSRPDPGSSATTDIMLFFEGLGLAAPGLVGVARKRKG